MPLQPGTKLGPYEVLSLIGAGGMGEVYKGRDSRLNRIVALKVLPKHLAERADLLERFEREATTIANLKHAHICVLYDIGEQELEAEDVAPASGRPLEPPRRRRYEARFLVLEFLEGETLAQRLLKGPMPLEHVLRYAMEVSDALDKAHRSGVTHRDIKPGNIMLTKEGSKILDFGLAKLKQEAVAPNLPQSLIPTAPSGLTQDGQILGTLQYMSPEQIEGKIDDIDPRTDIFAFGAVVYEMITGKKAFEGNSTASVISKILQVDPPAMSSLQPLTPPALDRVVKKCLCKDRDDRWHSAKDLCDELTWIKEGGREPAKAPVPEAKPVPMDWRRAVLVGLACLVVGALAATVAVWNLRPAPPPPPLSRFVVTPPLSTPLVGLNEPAGPAIALSPDGTQMAYVGATPGGIQQLFLRALDSLDVKPIPGTEGGSSPFFSPDGKWIGFFAENKLKKISVSGGAAVTLCNAPGPQRSASWGTNDIIIFHALPLSALLQVPAGGGNPNAFSSLKGEFKHDWPEFLPGGKAVLFTAFSSGSKDDAQIVAQEFPTGERKVLVQGGTNPRYVPTGHLVYAHAGTLMAVPFNLARLEVSGAPVPILEDVMDSPETAAQFSVSSLGSLAYIPGRFSGDERRLVWVDRRGIAQPLAAPPRDYQAPRLSPDGRRISSTSQGSVWLYDIGRDTLTRLTFQRIENSFSAWTPDGKRVTFQVSKAGPSGLFWKPADGSGPEEPLMTSEYFLTPGSWSPDGQLLAFYEMRPETNRDIWVLPVQEDRKPRPFLRTGFNERGPMFSPDGRWLAYVSDESGRDEIYVQPFPGPGGKWQISTEGGIEPIWARNGEILYRNGDKMMAVETTTQPTFSASKPRLLFEGQYERAPAGVAGYDVSPDGQRFLMLKPVESQASAPTQINVVLNWFEELKRRVPVKQ